MFIAWRRSKCECRQRPPLTTNHQELLLCLLLLCCWAVWYLLFNCLFNICDFNNFFISHSIRCFALLPFLFLFLFCTFCKHSSSILIEFSISSAVSSAAHIHLQFVFVYIYRSCIIGPELTIKVCSIGTVINRIAYAADYCQLEGTSGRQTQPMPIRWMAWESVLLVSLPWNLCKRKKKQKYQKIILMLIVLIPTF